MENSQDNNNNNGNDATNGNAIANDNPVTLEYKTTGNHTEVPRTKNFTFPNTDTMGRWLKEVGTLREEASLKSKGNPSRQDGLIWLEHFHTFHNHWGSDFVPHDIKRSVHHTQMHLGLPLTQW